MEIASKEKVISFEQAKRDMKTLKKLSCKNAVLFIEPTKDAKELFSFTVSNKGCLNLRRNGSAWCQECSDNHRGMIKV